MEQSISDHTVRLIQRSLGESEQIVWTGKPQPRSPSERSDKIVVAACYAAVPVILGCAAYALASNRMFCLLLTPFALFCIIKALRGFRSANSHPLAYEEYALTNQRAFSFCFANGIDFLGAMPLDDQTRVRKWAFGVGTSVLLFTRSHEPPPVSRSFLVPGKPGRTSMAFMNIRDGDRAMSAALFAIAGSTDYRHRASNQFGDQSR